MIKTDIQLVDPKLLKLSPKFKKAFTIKPENVRAIADDMKKNGYDNTFPIICDSVTSYVIDGHTRRQAAIDAGLIRVPVIYKQIGSEDKALDYILHTQTARRNLDTADIIRLLLKDSEYLEAPSKKKYIAEKYKISISKAGQIMAIMKDGRKMAVILKRNDDGTTRKDIPARTRGKSLKSSIVIKCETLLKVTNEAAGQLTDNELEALSNLKKHISKVIKKERERIA